MYKAVGSKKYLEQWERVNRWYRKVKIIEQDSGIKSDDECLDEVYAFFINCFQMKDWIKNSNSDDSLSKEIERLFSGDQGKECFQICADFSNGLKHLTIGRYIRKDSNSRVVKQGVTIHVNLSTLFRLGTDVSGRAVYNWKILWNGNEYDVYELADQVIKEWTGFLKDRNLI